MFSSREQTSANQLALGRSRGVWLHRTSLGTRDCSLGSVLHRGTHAGPSVGTHQDSTLSGPAPQAQLSPNYCTSFKWLCLASSQSHSVVPDSLQLSRTIQSTRLLCPWVSPGKNTGVGSHSLLQGIFLTQGSNMGLLHCWQILYHLSNRGSPKSGFKQVQKGCFTLVHINILEHTLDPSRSHSITEANLEMLMAAREGRISCHILSHAAQQRKPQVQHF